MTGPARRFTTALAAALAGAWTVVACAAQGPGLTKEQAEELLQAHNAWRRNVGVRPLRWSSELARSAQAHADRLASRGCRLEHGGAPKNAGQNLFGATALRAGGEEDRVGELVPAQVVNWWAAEAADYDYARNRCAEGKQCTHYTQIVWKSTREVGCGMSVCPSRGQVWVCNYRPGGNLVGEKPY